MSTLSGRPAGAAVILGGMVYVLFLAAALIWLHLSPEMVLALTLGGIGVPILCLRPVIGIHLFLMVFYFENAFGVDVPVMKAVGAVVLTGWLLNATIRRSARLNLHTLVIVIALFVVWCGVTALFAENSQDSITTSLQFAQLAIATLMFNSVLDTTPRIRALCWAIVLWAALSTFIAIVMYYTGRTAVAQGLMQNRNLLAIHINVAVIVAYILFQTARTPAAKGVLLAIFPVFFLGMALTLSRTGLVALILSLLFLWFRLAKERGFFVIGSTMTVLCLVCFLLPETFWKRAGTILPAIERQEDTFGLRVKIWKVGLEMVRDHPVTGVGAGNFLLSFSRYAHGRFLWRHLSPHNAFVGVSAEMGLVGLGLFILVLLFGLATARGAIVSGTIAHLPELRSLAIVVEVSLLAQIVSCFTGDVELFKLLWIMFGMALSLNRLGEEALERQRMASSAPLAQSVPVTAPGWGLVQ